MQNMCEKNLQKTSLWCCVLWTWVWLSGWLWLSIVLLSNKLWISATVKLSFPEENRKETWVTFKNDLICNLALCQNFKVNNNGWSRNTWLLLIWWKLQQDWWRSQSEVCWSISTNIGVIYLKPTMSALCLNFIQISPGSESGAMWCVIICSTQEVNQGRRFSLLSLCLQTVSSLCHPTTDMPWMRLRSKHTLKIQWRRIGMFRRWKMMWYGFSWLTETRGRLYRQMHAYTYEDKL